MAPEVAPTYYGANGHPLPPGSPEPPVTTWRRRQARYWLTAELEDWGGAATLHALYESALAVGIGHRLLEAAVDEHVRCGMARRAGWGYGFAHGTPVPPIIELTRAGPSSIDTPPPPADQP